MKFTASISFWVRRYFSARNLVILALLTGVLFYGVYKGALDWNKSKEDCRAFKEIEIYNFHSINNYTSYSIIGLNVFFYPPSASIYFSNPSLFSEMSGRINSIIVSNISSDCRNRSIFKANSPLRFRFSDLVLVFAGLAVLLLGLDYFRSREFLRFLTAHRSIWGVYVTVIITGILLTACCLTLILGISLFMLKLKGIVFTGSNFSGILTYLLTANLVLMLFFVLGSILGSIPCRSARVSGVLTIFIFLVFALPTVFDSIIEGKANDLLHSRYYDYKKLKTVDDFEDIYINERGGAKNYTLEEARVIVGSYLRDVFPKIEQEDVTEQEKITEVVRDYWDLAILSPATFYTMTCQELSGRGYKSYLEFFDYLFSMRHRFLEFWIDRVYYHDRNKMVNFIKGDENVFKSSSRVPPNYWLGFFIQSGYILLCLMLSYLAFLVSLYYMDKRHLAQLGQADLRFMAGILHVQLIDGNFLRNALFATLAGKTKRLAKIGFKATCVDKENKPLPLGRKGRVSYIPCLDNLPAGIKAKSLLVYWGKRNSINREEIAAILSAEELQPLLKKKLGELGKKERFPVSRAMVNLSCGRIYLIDDIIANATKEEVIDFKRELDGLASRGDVVILLTAPRLVSADDIPKGQCFGDGGTWLHKMASDAISLALSRELEKEKETKKEEREKEK